MNEIDDTVGNTVGNTVGTVGTVVGDETDETHYETQDLYDTILDYRDHLIDEGGSAFDYLRYLHIDTIIELIGNYFYYYNPPSDVYTTRELTNRELDDYALLFLVILDDEGYSDKITTTVIHDLDLKLRSLKSQI